MSENKKITKIQDYLTHQSEEQRGVIEAMMMLVEKTVPGVELRVMWSAPWYLLNGKYFVWFGTARQHVSFGFAFGAQLESDILEGTGKNMRHVKIKSRGDLQEKEVELVKLLKMASQL